MSWQDEAEKELCEALNNGDISPQRFAKEMRKLDEKIKTEAQDVAKKAKEDL